MTLPLLLCRDDYAGAELERLSRRFSVEIVGPVVPVLEAGARPTVVWTWRERVDGALCDRVGTLRAVVNHGVGTELIDVAGLERRGIAVIAPSGANADAVADHTLMLLLAVRHRLIAADAHVRSGAWEAGAPSGPAGDDVFGSTLGIVGLGACGRAVARRARGFAMRLLYAAPRRADASVERELAVEHVSLDELLARSDAVTLHCPLTAETRGLIGARELALLRPTAVVVNAARGPVCDEDSLIAALAAGRIAGAGLDVFADEPRVPAALRALPSVVLTPHAADVTRGTQAAMSRRCVDALLALPLSD